MGDLVLDSIGSIIGVIKGDTRSLDTGSYEYFAGWRGACVDVEGFLNPHLCCLGGSALGFRF